MNPEPELLEIGKGTCLGDFHCLGGSQSNTATRTKDANPLPRIDDSLASMSGAAFFSNLDLTSGYWQVPVNKDHRDKTAFLIGTNLYYIKRFPYGPCNAPPLFQRLMELAFADMSWEVMLTYLDDLAIFTKTFDEHLEVLEEVFQRLHKAGLKLQPSKCNLCKDQIIFLGHHVSRLGIKPDPLNIQKIKDWSVPKTVKQETFRSCWASFGRGSQRKTLDCGWQLAFNRGWH
ncbi:PREDICTED: RNA-directed DNA polymerase homolog [Priapulus caudatus]|uniref:RNA-directed DNA polymerase homolog n=1 Tax=Priapulus caudatus TaxID=37621 RepID=A0ABM1EPX8_PRICU|nr:PREDICTED: RNA-directed DNA polymerase homolog [Priapulus caudatus]